MSEKILTAVGFGVAIWVAGLTNWGGLSWAALMGVDLPDLLLLKTAPQALSSAAALCALACVWVRGPLGPRRLFGVQAGASALLSCVLVALLLLAGRGSGAVAGVACVAGSVLMGVASGVLLGAWGAAAVRRSAGAGMSGGVALVVDVALNLACGGLSDAGRVRLLVGVLAALAAACLLAARFLRVAAAPGCPEGSSGGDAASAPSGPGGLRAFVAQRPAVRAQLVCMVALVFGFSFVRTTALSEVEDRSSLNVYGNALIGLAAVAALVWSAFRTRGGRARGKGDGGASAADFTVPFSVVIPVVATLAVLMPALAGPALLAAAAVLHAAFFVILAFLPTVARRGLPTCDRSGSQSDPETFVLLLGAGTFASVGVSTLLSWVVYRNSAVSVTTLLVCALAITYAMVVAYAFLQREARSARHHEVLVEEERMTQPACEPQAGPTRHEAVERIARTYLLTGRESDVLLLLARGYSQRGIAGRLDVSDNTVRTHLRNLYRKLQIHSRQEAIELVERERAQGR